MDFIISGVTIAFTIVAISFIGIAIFLLIVSSFIDESHHHNTK